MYTLTTAAALLATAGQVFAAPSALVPRKTFQVSQIAKGKVFINGPQQVVKTHEKYAKVGAVVPSDAATAAATVQSGSVAANPEQYDTSYLSPVSVGGQTLNLDFDTGSSDLWVFSTVTPSNQATGHARYNPATSGTLKSGYSWKISYGDGSGASGTVYADKVVVGGVTATSQAVEAATSVSSSFTSDTDNDGLLGLAFSSINTVTPQKQTTFFDTVKPTLAKPLFAVDLKKGAAGSYQFGYIDSTKYTGSVTYVPVDTSNGFWQFTAGGYSVGSSTTTSSSISGASIADTGTSLLYLPDAVVKAYYSKVSGASYDSAQGGYTFPSSSTLPNFNVNIGGAVFTVPGSYIKFAPVSSTRYFGGIQSSAGIGFNIFGDVFLKAVYAIFDETNGVSSPRLGFAKQS